MFFKKAGLPKLMSQLDLKSKAHKDQFILAFGTDNYRDRDGDRVLMLTVRDSSKAKVVSVDAPQLYRVPQNRRDRFAEAAMAVQWRVKFLRYELDESDGEVRGCIELPYSADQFVTVRQLKRALKALRQLVDEYDPFLRSALESNRVNFDQLP